ncbi:MAG: [Spirochaetales bacterium]|nr:[FeFe] hydrogenase H-cluster radical SAM maturase HydE [Spirochaetales bacterium]
MNLADKLYKTADLSDEELKSLIETDDQNIAEALRQYADETRRKHYGDKVFLRGLIEISSYCKNDCLYCGLRRSNTHADRYRLSIEDILACCDNGYKLGFRTFVMQGGEDVYYNDDILCGLISEIKSKYPDCAVTLSLGERSLESYTQLKSAGADRYLLRHEAASAELYTKLHPSEMSLDKRKRCLYQLKELGYQVGSGFMVGAPYQTTEHIISDLRFLQQLQPQMIGIGPFIPHHNTPFKDMPNGTLKLTLRLLGILRLLFPT